MATGLGLSVALSSLGSATVALAAEQPAVEAALEITEPSEVEDLNATGEVEDQTAPETDGAVNEEVNSETIEVNTETEAEEETEDPETNH